jgi:hypothetical protein
VSGAVVLELGERVSELGAVVWAVGKALSVRGESRPDLGAVRPALGERLSVFGAALWEYRAVLPACGEALCEDGERLSVLGEVPCVPKRCALSALRDFTQTLRERSILAACGG